ncbi:MAG: c-type cytochrome [Spirosomaceae bacterium]|jgi:thiosulfate dehydrogenase|nr:c-type cytochrome [Spirosomataceae bacterium]
MQNINNQILDRMTGVYRVMILLLVLTFVLVGVLTLSYFGVFAALQTAAQKSKAKRNSYVEVKPPLWKPISMEAVWNEPNKDLIKYGKELISNTSVYLGPSGKVAHTSNGMNCQNCHLDAGSRAWGNNYGAVASTYPKFRERSGSVETIEKRVNDCFERSLNGKALDSSSREMKAIVAYIKYLGSYVPKDTIPKGTGIWKLKFMNRAADPAGGQVAYEQKCVSCHGRNGEGVLNPDKTAYTYPPLWGEHSYNQGAGLFRLSRFAGYIKANMPFGATYDKPQLSDEEAWDIAAYVNSRPRPTKDLSKDWPNIAGKPFDHPFGPYVDEFSEEQHKFGPFKPIDDAIKKRKKAQQKANKLAKN